MEGEVFKIKGFNVVGVVGVANIMGESGAANWGEAGEVSIKVANGLFPIKPMGLLSEKSKGR